MIPSKKKWQNWSLPSKYTALGIVIGIVGIIIALIALVLDSNTKETDGIHMPSGTFIVGDLPTYHINIRFSLSDSQALFLLPPIPKGEDEKNLVSFPLSLAVENTGEITARNCVLELFHAKGFVITESNLQDLNQKGFYDGSLVKTATSINLPSIPPGKTLYYEFLVYLSISYKFWLQDAPDIVEIKKNAMGGVKYYYMRVGGESKKSRITYSLPDGGYVEEFLPLEEDTEIVQEWGRRVRYRLEARIFAQDLSEKKTLLSITIGSSQALMHEPVFQFFFYKDERRVRKYISDPP